MTGTIHILDELRVALAAQTPEQGQELVELGVPAEIVWFVGAANIRPSDGLYEPDPGGEPVWIVPCVDRGENGSAGVGSRRSGARA